MVDMEKMTRKWTLVETTYTDVAIIPLGRYKVSREDRYAPLSIVMTTQHGGTSEPLEDWYMTDADISDLPTGAIPPSIQPSVIDGREYMPTIVGSRACELASLIDDEKAINLIGSYDPELLLEMTDKGLSWTAAEGSPLLAWYPLTDMKTVPGYACGSTQTEVPAALMLDDELEPLFKREGTEDGTGGEPADGSEG